MSVSLNVFKYYLFFLCSPSFFNSKGCILVIFHNYILNQADPDEGKYVNNNRTISNNLFHNFGFGDIGVSDLLGAGVKISDTVAS